MFIINVACSQSLVVIYESSIPFMFTSLNTEQYDVPKLLNLFSRSLCPRTVKSVFPPWNPQWMPVGFHIVYTI